MSLILNGTDGLSDVDGTAGTPAIRGTDANTGIFFPAADTIAFSEGGVEAMRIDSSGNVGIGLTAPTRLLHIDGGSSTTYFQMTNTASGRTNADGFQIAQDGANAELINREAGYLNFATSNTERMRITSGGDVCVGTSTALFSNASRGNITVNGSASSIMNFAVGGVAKGYFIHDDASFAVWNIDSSPLTFGTSDVERMRIDSSGNVGIGVTNPSSFYSLADNLVLGTGTSSHGLTIYSGSDSSGYIGFNDTVSNSMQGFIQYNHSGDYMAFAPNGSERMRIDSSGNVLVGKTSTSSSVAGTRIIPEGSIVISRNDELLFCNRLTTDGGLVVLQQDGITEGSISVSGSTVSYNGGHLSRWSQLPDGSKDDTILKGTVLSNLDDMCVWEKDGVVAENEQLNKMKVSDVEGDTNVAGVFVNWTIDADYGVDDMNVAMTGDMIIRIAQGVVVEKGDLLMSAGDGTAKPQGDDIVRSKTIAKVTSNHVTCTYADGSYCVPCVLMAC